MKRCPSCFRHMIWRPLCGLFVEHGCLLFFKFTLANAVLLVQEFSARIMTRFLHVRRQLRRKFRESTCTELPPRLLSHPGREKEANSKNNKQPRWTNRLHSGYIIFENKTGIPITPYKEGMIDGSESPNASESLNSGIAYQRIWWYYMIIQAKCSDRLHSSQPKSRSGKSQDHSTLSLNDQRIKVFAILTNPYNFEACLPNQYKHFILGDIWSAIILPCSSLI